MALHGSSLVPPLNNLGLHSLEDLYLKKSLIDIKYKIIFIKKSQQYDYAYSTNTYTNSKIKIQNTKLCKILNTMV